MTFNQWFLSLEEGRQEVLREDKWLLASAAFEAGKAIQQLSNNAIQDELLPCDTCGRLTHAELKYCGYCNGGSQSS